MSEKPERAIDVGGRGQTQINLSYVLWLEEEFAQLQSTNTTLEAENIRFIEYLNFLGIDPEDGSPTAEVIVAMRIQSLEADNRELADKLTTGYDLVAESIADKQQYDFAARAKSFIQSAKQILTRSKPNGSE